MKVAFIGGGQWGSAVLRAMVNAQFEIVVIDSPSVNGKTEFRSNLFLRSVLHNNRVLQTIYSFVTKEKNNFYETIWKYRLPVILTDSLNNRQFITKIKSTGIDVILVASCAEKLGNELINTPSLGCINCHPSLLPKYRGPNPFYWVIRNKEKETGITFHFINEQIDAGNIIFQQKIPIEKSDDEQSLISKCAALASSMSAEVLRRIKTKDVEVQPQNNNEATYFPAVKLRPSDKFYIKELSSAQNHLWDKYIKESLQYNFFSSSCWLSTVSEATRTNYKIIVCYDDDQPLCGCAALIRKSLEGALFTSLPLSQYSTILFFGENNRNAIYDNMSRQYIYLKSLLALTNYLISKFDWTVLYLHPNFSGGSLLGQNGWRLDTRYTYYLNLKEGENLYTSFSDSLKRNLKKYKKEEFHIEDDFNEIDSFYTIWKSTYLNQGVRVPLKFNEFQYIYQNLKEKNLLKIICAYDKKGKLAAGILFLVDKNIAYYWASALNRNYANIGVNQFLLWEGLKNLSQSGVQNFDFVGADIPSIAAYKKQFGGELIPHLRITHVSSARANIVRSAKYLYKYFAGKSYD